MLISKPGYQFAEREVDVKAPKNGRFEGPGRSMLRHKRRVHLKALERQFEAPEWIDFEAMGRV